MVTAQRASGRDLSRRAAKNCSGSRALYSAAKCPNAATSDILARMENEPPPFGTRFHYSSSVRHPTTLTTLHSQRRRQVKNRLRGANSARILFDRTRSLRKISLAFSSSARSPYHNHVFTEHPTLAPGRARRIGDLESFSRAFETARQCCCNFPRCSSKRGSKRLKTKTQMTLCALQNTDPSAQIKKQKVSPS